MKSALPVAETPKRCYCMKQQRGWNARRRKCLRFCLILHLRFADAGCAAERVAGAGSRAGAAASGLFHDGGALRVNRAAWTRNRRDLRAEFQETVFDSRHGLFRDPVADRHRRAGLHDRISRLISGNFRKIRAIQLDFYMICDSLLRKQTNHADRAEHCHSPGRTSDRGRNE